MNWLLSLFKAPEVISLPGLEIRVVHSLRTVYVVDQTGSNNIQGLEDLQEWTEKQGYFLHCVVVEVGKEK